MSPVRPIYGTEKTFRTAGGRTVKVEVSVIGRARDHALTQRGPEGDQGGTAGAGSCEG